LNPYIGITGFTTPEQVEYLLQHMTPGKRRLMVGVLVSDKTLAGIPVRYPRRNPTPDAIRDIFRPGCLNLAHYHTGDRHADLLALARRLRLTPGQGLQLNIAWPDPERVRALHREGYVVVLQVGPAALSELVDLADLERRLAGYGSAVDYVLVDLSAGEGVRLNPERTATLLQAVSRAVPHAGPVVAGGLGPALRLESLRDLLRGPAAAYRDGISIDAESGVRDAADALDLQACLTYLQEGLSLLEVSQAQ